MNKLLRQAMGNASTLFQANGPSVQSLLKEGLGAHQAGDMGRAATVYGLILEREPDHFDALHLLGVAALQTGNPEGALQLIDRALAVKGDVADAHSNRASALMELGRFEEARSSTVACLTLSPDSPDAHFNAGNALSKLGRHEEAASSFRRASELRPGFVQALTNWGGELIDLRDFTGARSVLEEAIACNDAHAKAHLNLGIVRQETGDLPGAESAFRTAIACDPNYHRARVNLANLLFSHGHIGPALEQCEAAIAGDPSNAEGHNALANCLRALGRSSEAVDAYRKAVACDTTSPAYHSNLILGMLGDADQTPDDIMDEALRYAARHALSAGRRGTASGPLRRIGFVSPDLRQHPIGLFLEPLLAHLKGVEACLYANQTEEDEVTASLRSHAALYRNVRSLDAHEVGRLVESDGVQVLIDLAGHTADGRLDVFALRPAPVQLTWLGFSGTTGLGQFDGLIGDAVVTPRAEEDAYAEPVLRLPHSFVGLFEPPTSLDPGPPPCQRNGFVTFGSANSTTKVNRNVVRVWSHVLRAVPDSRLVLKSLTFADPTAQEWYLSQFAACGIGAERVELNGHVPREDHWQWFRGVDISLDTFPYSGATTTLDSLWMGVPVVTVAGDRYAGRMSASFLKTLGLDDLVAADADGLVATATGLAQDTDRLKELRASLRARLEDSSLGQRAQFAADFVSVLNTVWASRTGQAA